MPRNIVSSTRTWFRFDRDLVYSNLLEHARVTYIRLELLVYITNSSQGTPVNRLS